MPRLTPIPLFGSGIAAISKAITAQRRLNCFWDIRKDGDKTDAALVGTPGLLLFTSLPTFPVRGWRVVGSFTYVVAGAVLYKMTGAGAHTVLGSLATGLTNKVSMSDNTSQLAIVDGTALYIYTIITGSYYQSALNAAGSFGTVTDFASQVASFATTISFIDGRFVVEMINSRQSYACKSYDGTDWGGGYGTVIYWTKESYSDNMSAIDSFAGFLVLWGESSLEWWQDVGTVPMPYSRITGSPQEWGLAAKWSRAKINIKTGSTIIFLGKTPQGQAKVCQIGAGGYAPVDIGTSDIDDIINDMGTFSDATALTYVAYGHIMYQLTFPIGGRTLLYDTSTGAWQEAQTDIGLTGRHVGDLGLAFNLENYASDYQNGNIYAYDVDTYTDNGVAIKRQVTSRHIRDGGNDFEISDVFLDMETGVGLQAGQGSDPQISMEKSKDNGQTFGQPRFRSLGKAGQYLSPRVHWDRNGTARDFVFRFTVTDPVKFVITGGSVAK